VVLSQTAGSSTLCSSECAVVDSLFVPPQLIPNPLININNKTGIVVASSEILDA